VHPEGTEGDVMQLANLTMKTLKNYPFGKPTKILREQYSQIAAMLRPLGKSGLKVDHKRSDKK
jgi:hypothetical protein